MVNFPGVLREGENCWRIAQAPRAAFLIDADAYFTAFRHAVSRARDSVVHRSAGTSTAASSSTPAPRSRRCTLLPFLNDVLARRPELRVFALAWDFSVLFTLEREPFPTYRFAWNAHPRLAFQLDDAHPFSGSHHQKIVVVDDALAFAGGLDLTIRRWDTPAHQAHEPARVDPDRPPLPADARRPDDRRRRRRPPRWASSRARAGTPPPARRRCRRPGPDRPARRSVARGRSPRRARRADRHRPHDAGVSRRARRCTRSRRCARAVDRLGAPLHLHREPVPDVGGDRRGAGAPAGRARRAGDRRRAARARSTAGWSRARWASCARACCGTCSAPIVTAACASSSRPSPASSRAA